ncbi:nicotinamide-nucleotide amidohydrolase family protein [Filomicrobium sp.]|uniref:CinA family protein n=1 Tax=Filomicrobium sp. TaxID=2024831 RepID=UPI00258A2FB9|nr:nicotinamide-nucleotide amidohydrolase family protein [Filomicrobium sp.]MCV0371094.1 CinA family protein [Filomicrobium sp.]
MKRAVSDVPVLASNLLAAAKKHGLTIATAESCTAGALATALADAPGGGEQFHCGFVTYTKQSKTIILGVPPRLIRTFTAVSQPVAEAMARGCLARSPADFGIAVTGVAGPEPDEDNNPIGKILVAIALCDGGIWHRDYDFRKRARPAMREAILKATLIFALQCCEVAKVAKQAS